MPPTIDYSEPFLSLSRPRLLPKEDLASRALRLRRTTSRWLLGLAIMYVLVGLLVTLFDSFLDDADSSSRLIVLIIYIVLAFIGALQATVAWRVARGSRPWALVGIILIAITFGIVLLLSGALSFITIHAVVSHEIDTGSIMVVLVILFGSFSLIAAHYLPLLIRLRHLLAAPPPAETTTAPAPATSPSFGNPP